MANTSCPFIHWWWPCTCRKSPAKVKKFIVSQVEWKLQFGLVWLRINPRRCEVEAWCELDEVTREKLSNTWQRSDRTSVRMFCDRHEVKPNRKFDSVRGLVDRNFRTVRPRFSIQFSISSPVIVRNRRIEPKFGLLNLSNEKSNDRTTEEQTRADRCLTKINSWRTAWRSLLTKFFAD